MTDKELLEQIADKDCECVDNEEGIRCNACMAAGALNTCSKMLNGALEEINNK